MKPTNESLGGGTPRKDPFGDLVRAVEGGGARTVAGSEPIYAGFEPVEVPLQSNWDSFTYDRGSAPRRSPAQSGSMASVAVPSVSGEMRLDGPDADLQIDEALRGLSSPARPRVNAPAETQSFAPARQADEHAPTGGRTLDDFDELIASELAAMRTVPAHDEDDGYYADYDDEEAYEAPRRIVRGRSLAMTVGGVAAVVVLGAVGVLAWSGAVPVGGSADGPLLIKADAEPFKIAPADPGGRSIPNQNKAVYGSVAGGPIAAPTQHELVTAIEEPLEIAEDEPAADALPGVEVGDEVPLPGEAASQVAEREPESETLQPRKVRTLTVRPDGTLVASDAPADASGASALLPASSTAHAAVLDPVAGIAPSMPFGDDAAMTTASTMPAAEPVAQEVAAVATPASPTAGELADAPRVGDGFYVQISSQPNEAAARDSMSSLTRRFSSQIGTRGVGIRTAEIPGKGTFYRVRIAAESRDEAVELCETLKSAGGSCFVTR
ncbi:SPOR domain-containing protein [Aureimonas jatrophae]|uniref:Sporulation related domain-containing protein n=1 Tax=Aureimonas jatrophae TaxID=1166073 RepID=A0A1H0MTP2_9HYPH|nr:SPOR domain-containing protein [Aureimonas jatrophae]MBB3951224.1 hypothetical protein [Aureimonas jatrophae]SDO83819.1 Sporulation related domain-containing protein [Aureimonas jatrophae]